MISKQWLSDRHTFASLWGACLRFASLWRTNSRGDSCVLKRLLRSFSVHLLKVCWIFVKRTYFKSLLKVYYRSVFAESFKTFIFQKFQLPLYHKVNLLSCVARRPLCHKVNLPRCEARRRRFIETCDIFGTGQRNILALCYLFRKTYKQPTVAPLKSLKSTHSALAGEWFPYDSWTFFLSDPAPITAIVAIIWKLSLIHRNNHPPFLLSSYLYALQTYRKHSSKLQLLLVL